MSERHVLDAAAVVRAARTGEGVYDTFLVGPDRLHPAWPLHLGRLLDDAERIGLPAPTPTALRALLVAIDAAADRAQRLDVRVRIRVDALAVGPDNLRVPPSTMAFAVDVQPASDRIRPPARVVVGPPLRNAADPVAGCKRTATPTERLLARAGRDEVLLRDVAGRLSEGLTSALLLCDGAGRLRTPDATAAPLRSTTAALLAAAAPAAGLSFEALPLAVDAWRGGSALLLNAVAGGRPIAAIDGEPLPPPPDEVVALCRELVDGGPTARVAVEALERGAGPAWAQAAIARGRAVVQRHGTGIAAFA